MADTIGFRIALVERELHSASVARAMLSAYAGGSDARVETSIALQRAIRRVDAALMRGVIAEDN